MLAPQGDKRAPSYSTIAKVTDAAKTLVGGRQESFDFAQDRLLRCRESGML
jgi:hypothetical protein